MRMVGVGVSNRNQDPTHPPNPSDPAREPADPTSMTVDDGSLPPEPKNDGSVGGFSPQNPKKPDRTEIWPSLSITICSSPMSTFADLAHRRSRPLHRRSLPPRRRSVLFVLDVRSSSSMSLARLRPHLSDSSSPPWNFHLLGSVIYEIAVYCCFCSLDLWICSLGL